MNLDELRSIQSKERQKDSLQNLRPTFYQEVGEYIASLETERDRVAEQADDPFSSPEVSRLTDEIETAKDVVEAVYERRMGKLVKQASLAAAGMAANDEGLTAEEGDLFEDLVDRIGSNKNRVLDVLENVDDTAVASSATETDSPRTAESEDSTIHAADAAPDQHSSDDAPQPPPDHRPADTGRTKDEMTEPGSETVSDDSSGVSPADVMGESGSAVDEADDNAAGRDEATSTSHNTQPTKAGNENSGEPDQTNATPISDTSSESASHGADPGPGADAGANDGANTVTADVDRTTVRITSDIGSILGVDDREYTLTSDDVVTLPEQNAAPLVDREAAERLE
ncbi:hypothetical protein [Natrinema halophilum]|uniref:Gins51 C-terminal domain-containing protein n=1 Tax=Natrinema halophilum TaxID=1699371 RepID=A0A7D5GGE6_9EURY|nr:hypothetical protein [Natrinema halophilum]QLG48248.1 hypothetical protein HYG82_04990 [Natrinema halophilum]